MKLVRVLEVLNRMPPTFRGLDLVLFPLTSLFWMASVVVFPRPCSIIRPASELPVMELP